MFKIRRIFDHTQRREKDVLAQFQTILRSDFNLSERYIQMPLEQLSNPLKFGFKPILFFSEGRRSKVSGFAFLLHAPDLNFCYLDYLAVKPKMRDHGIGASLYERVRSEARALKTDGIFFECIPDEPSIITDPTALRFHEARLRFYERYGARPIINTAYELPLRDVPKDESNSRYLVYDDLGSAKPLRRRRFQSIVSAILKRNYGDAVPESYLRMLLSSIKDDPVMLRPVKYGVEQKPPKPIPIPDDQRIILVVNDLHEIHHIPERGYVESPVRIKSILAGIEKTMLFTRVPAVEHSTRHILGVHDQDMFSFIQESCNRLEDKELLYPYVFPIRNENRKPRDFLTLAGYFCIDSFTPMSNKVYLAAKHAVDCTLTATQHILDGANIAYALVRPPGHHAERGIFGGFCYFNNNAIAAQALSKHGKVAILDLDYHHGNGQQNIFYERTDVLTVSIHGDPAYTYPCFSGFANERGKGEGKGFNQNYPLPENIESQTHLETVEKAIKTVARFKPSFLVVALGLDTAKGDPTGTWSLKTSDFQRMGEKIGALHIPTLVVQEGGYRTKNLGANAANFFIGLWDGYYQEYKGIAKNIYRRKL